MVSKIEILSLNRFGYFVVVVVVVVILIEDITLKYFLFINITRVRF